MSFEIRVTGKRLAAFAVLVMAGTLAVAAVAAKGAAAGPAETAGYVQRILSQTDHVTPVELAGWLLEKKQDYVLIDIRDPWQFDDYHIPTAVNMPLAQLFEGAGLAKLPRGKKVVIYGLGAGHAAQAELLLRMKGFDAYSLKEGISAWWAYVMTPTSLRSEEQSPAGYLQAKQLRERFMGASTPGAGTEAAPAAAPVSPPETPAGKPAAAPGKLKLGRGCS